MFKLYVSLFAACLLATTLFAQPRFAPLGARWNYTFHLHDGGLESEYEVRVTHDTLIGNTQVKTLTLFENVLFAMPPHQFYARTETFGTLQYRNDSVTITNSLAGTEGYLFDFEMVVGDSIPMWAPGGTMYGIVTAVDSMVVGAVTKQRWHLTKYCDGVFMNDFQIVEGIGPIDEFLVYNHEGCQLGIGWWTMNCYSSDSLQYNEPCPQIIMPGVPDALDAAHLTLTPNPAGDRVQIVGLEATAATQVQVMDLQGRIVWKSMVDQFPNNTIPTSEWPQGMYWVRIMDEGASKMLPLAIVR